MRDTKFPTSIFFSVQYSTQTTVITLIAHCMHRDRLRRTLGPIGGFPASGKKDIGGTID
jgi:hypothetical protein